MTDNALQADHALRRAQDRLKVALIAARMAIWEWNPETDRLEGEGTMGALFGLRPGEALGSRVEALRLVHPEDVEAHRARVEAAMRTGGSWHGEFRIVRPCDGEVAWLEERAHAVRDPHTGRLDLFGVVWDITERKRAEESLRSSEARQAFLLQLGDRLRVLYDPHAIMRAACEALGRHLGVASVQYTLVDADQDTAAIAAAYNDGRLPGLVQGHRFRLDADAPGWGRSLRDGVEVFAEDLGSGDSASGREPWPAPGVRAGTAVPLLKDGRLVAWLSSSHPQPRRWNEHERQLHRDVAERTWAAVERARAEHALRRSEEKYRQLFDSIDEGFSVQEVVFDAAQVPVDLRYLQVNAAFEQLTGLADAVGRTARALVPDLEDFWLDIHAGVALTGEPVRHEHYVRSLDRWFDVYLFRTGEPGEHRVAAIFSDVTERKRAEEALRLASAELEARVEERTRELALLNDSLRAEMAQRARAEQSRHELLRQLINAQEAERRRISRELHDELGQQVSALALKVAMLKRDGRVPEAVREELARLERIAGAIDNDLDFLVWHLRPTVLDDLGLAAALGDYVENWSAHFGIEARVSAPNGAAARLDPGVETVLYRVAQEALNNVAKHAHARHVAIALAQQDHEVALTIEDDGSGFDAAAASPRPGGLGLVGMRERAALVGGQVVVRSRRGKGTTIAVHVPLPRTI